MCVILLAHYALGSNFVSAGRAAINESRSVYLRMPLSECLNRTSLPLNTRLPPC